MRFVKLIPAVLLAAGLTLAGPLADDSGKSSAPSKPANPYPNPSVAVAPGQFTPPVLRTVEKDDTTIVTLPGFAPAPASPPPKAIASATAPKPGPPLPPPPDPDRPILHRAIPAYPVEFGKESAVFCQQQIGAWGLDDAIAIFGEPKSRRPSMSDEGIENGAIFAFADPSSHYREIELDFDGETGDLRTVFAYPWKMSWQDCRKLWGNRVSAADADKGRVFYSYLDRRMDVLVDSVGKVISFGLY